MPERDKREQDGMNSAGYEAQPTAYKEERGSDADERRLPKSTIYMDTREGSMNDSDEQDQVSDGVQNENLGHATTSDHKLLEAHHIENETAEDAGRPAHRLDS